MLRADDATGGISFTSGRAIEGMDDLPPHLVEVHRFPDADMAAAFAAGVRACRATGTWVVHEPGTRETNRLVALAFAGEPRPAAAAPEDAVPCIDHGRTTHDAEAEEARRKSSRDERRREEEAARAGVAPFLSELGKLGIDAAFSGPGWVVVGMPAPIGGRGALAGIPGRGMVLRFPVDGLLAGDPSLREMAVGSLARCGVRVDAFGNGIVDRIVDAAGASRAIARAVAAHGVASDERSAEETRRMLASTRMTAARARIVRLASAPMVPEGADGRLRVGRRSIDGAERDLWVAMGWLSIDAETYVVTACAREAAAADRAAQRSPRA